MINKKKKRKTMTTKKQTEKVASSVVDYSDDDNTAVAEASGTVAAASIDADDVSINVRKIDELDLSRLVTERPVIEKGQYHCVITKVEKDDSKLSEGEVLIKVTMALDLSYHKGERAAMTVPEVGSKEVTRPVGKFILQDFLRFFDDAVKRLDTKKQQQSSISLQRAGLLMKAALGDKMTIHELHKCQGKKVIVNLGYNPKSEKKGVEYAASNSVKSYLPIEE